MAKIIEKAEDYMSSAKISHIVLRDKLSEFLAVEKGGLKLYEEALRIVTDQEISKKFRMFYDQTRKHETILLRVMQAFGMDPTYMSIGAKVATEKAEALLKDNDQRTLGPRGGDQRGGEHRPGRNQGLC
jgi:rubrerythrin